MDIYSTCPTATDETNESKYDFAEKLEDGFSDLGMDLYEVLDDDEQFKKDILHFIIQTGENFNQICFGIVALASYVLERTRPDHCGMFDFQSFWIEPCEYNPIMIATVDAALERAYKRLNDESSLRAKGQGYQANTKGRDSM